MRSIITNYRTVPVWFDDETGMFIVNGIEFPTEEEAVEYIRDEFGL